jgi:pimeloyl-ACP methyl ester carboxylesterase
MRVWTAGSGPPLLAVHGLGGSGRYWRRLADDVGDRLEVVAPDLAGFGSSAKPGGERYDLASHVADLDAALGGDAAPVAVVGHSIGGVIAAAWAVERAERVSALVLLATPFPPGDGENAWMREGVPPAGSRAVMRTFRVLVRLLSLPVGVARRYPTAVALDYGRQGFVGRARTTWWAMHDPGVSARVERMTAALAAVPVLLLNARDDHTVATRDQERWAAALPKADRVVLDRGGHQFPLRGGSDALATWLADTLRP